jgi:hypothetical protein
MRVAERITLQVRAPASTPRESYVQLHQRMHDMRHDSESRWPIAFWCTVAPYSSLLELELPPQP